MFLEFQMKILHVIDHMGLGGAQEIVRGLATINNSIVISLNDNNKYSKYSLIPLFKLFKFLKNNPDTRIIHSHLLKSKIISYILSFYFSDMKLVFHEHGNIRRGYYLYFLKLAQHKVRTFVVINQIQKKYLEKHLWNINIVYMPNFTNIEIVRTPKLNNVNFGLVGRLVPTKGFDIFLKNYKKCNIGNKKITIYGDGPEKAKLEKIVIDLELENVKIISNITDKKDLYKNIDTLIIPSKHESFGLVAIEAMASGIPVIASGVGGLKELIIDGQNGLLIDLKFTDCLCVAIRKLDNIRFRRRLISNGYATVKKYQFKTIIKTWEALYDKLQTEV